MNEGPALQFDVRFIFFLFLFFIFADRDYLMKKKIGS